MITKKAEVIRTYGTANSLDAIHTYESEMPPGVNYLTFRTCVRTVK